MQALKAVIMVWAVVSMLTGCTTFTLVAPHGSWAIQKISCHSSNPGNKPRMTRDMPQSGKGSACPLQEGITCS